MPQCADIAPMMRCFFDKETSSKKQHNCICCCMKFSDLQNLHALGRRLRLQLFSGRRNPPSHRFAFFVSPPVSIFFSAFFSFLFLFSLFASPASPCFSCHAFLPSACMCARESSCMPQNCKAQQQTCAALISPCRYEDLLRTTVLWISPLPPPDSSTGMCLRLSPGVWRPLFRGPLLPR